MSAPKRNRKPRGTIRRSVALPAILVEQVSEAAPPEYRGNVNAIVRTALEAYLRNRRLESLEREMDAMAADPKLRAASDEIFRAMETVDGDRLPPS